MGRPNVKFDKSPDSVLYYHCPKRSSPNLVRGERGRRKPKSAARSAQGRQKLEQNPRKGEVPWDSFLLPGLGMSAATQFNQRTLCQAQARTNPLIASRYCFMPTSMMSLWLACGMMTSRLSLAAELRNRSSPSLGGTRLSYSP